MKKAMVQIKRDWFDTALENYERGETYGSGYISKLCLRPFYHSESGKIIMQVDEELKGEIYTDMMKAILKFEIRVK